MEGVIIHMSLGFYGLPKDWLQIIVFIHVFSAIIGIGPTYFCHVLLRKGQTLGQLRNSLNLVKLLEMFPKILGSLAVVSGLLLTWQGKYGFKELWIYGSIILYVIIQIVVIGFMAPRSHKLAKAAAASSDPVDLPVSSVLGAQVAKVNAYNYIATCLGVLLFFFMFFKPTL
jgi:uncharacterized membrane protein